MVATITTNKIFTGKLYAKENPNSCVVDVEVNILLSLKGGGTKNQTNRVAQNTYSIKFSALQTPRKIQNSFLKRALIC